MMGRSLVLVAALAASAFADNAPPPTEAQKQAAGNLVKQAIAKSQANDHDGAIKLYLEAFQIVPNPILLSNVGSEFKQAKKFVEALKYFCMYLEKDPTGANASYALSEATILHMELGKPGDVCKPEPVVKQDSPPAGNVIIQQPPPKPSGGGGGMRIAGLGTAGAGVLALGAGVFFGLKAKENSDLITNHAMDEEWPANIKQIEADGQSYENKQVIFTIAGGALVATGVVIYFLGRSKKSESAVSVTPTATADSVGVTIGGGF